MIKKRSGRISQGIGLATRLRADLMGRGVHSYAQCGEDVFLVNECYLPDRGTYVDIGAGHPYFGSNTFLFYRRGWQGLTIDPNPDHGRLHRIVRPDDTFLELGVATKASELEYFRFTNPDFNTFDSNARDRAISNNGKLTGSTRIPVRPLVDILGEHGVTEAFDLLSVDCEGLDLDVLNSNDWMRFRPRIVLVEDLPSVEDPFQVTEVHKTMTQVDYRRRATVGYTAVYQAKEQR
ncbi:MAG: FkbM family methyltransferase [Pseudomonadota bacterium]